jgi:hypothetical protein
VDTGAAISVLPYTSTKPSSGPPLSGADRKSIPSWGSIRKTLNFGIRTLHIHLGRRLQTHSRRQFFLSANRLLVDPHFGQVLDANTLDPISGSESSSHKSRLAASLCHVALAVRALLASFPPIVGDGSGTPNPKHGVFHSIETTGRPGFAKARRLDRGKGIPEPRKGRNRPKIQFTLVFPTPHGTKAGRLLETMWRLPPSQFGHQT